MPESAAQRAERLHSMPFERHTSDTPGLFRGLGESLAELWRRRQLVGMLVSRELKARYKDSALGFVWALAKPVTLLLIYYFAIGVFLGAARAIPSFAIFIFAGLTLWGLYSEMLVAGTNSVYGNAPLIRKVDLPREVFPLAAVGSAVVNFGIQFSVLVGAMLVLGQFPLSADILYIIPAVLIIMLFGAASAILFSALNVYLRDIAYLIEVAVLVLFWASPIVYSWQMVHSAIGGTLGEWIYLANPVTPAVLAFQRGTWLNGPEAQEFFAANGIEPTAMYPEQLDLILIIMIGVGIVYLWIAHTVFRRLQGNFAQEI